MNKQEIINTLIKLNFSVNDFFIGFGAAEVFYNIKFETEDIDIDVNPELFNTLIEQFNPEISISYLGSRYFTLPEFKIQIFENILFDKTVVIEESGFHVEHPEFIIQRRLKLERKKDFESITKIKSKFNI